MLVSWFFEFYETRSKPTGRRFIELASPAPEIKISPPWLQIYRDNIQSATIDKGRRAILTFIIFLLLLRKAGTSSNRYLHKLCKRQVLSFYISPKSRQMCLCLCLNKSPLFWRSSLPILWFSSQFLDWRLVFRGVSPGNETIWRCIIPSFNSIPSADGTVSFSSCRSYGHSNEYFSGVNTIRLE